MGIERYGEHYIRRQDPKGRDYYWATNDPPPRRTAHPTDLTMLSDGHVTISPLQFDMTDMPTLTTMANWDLKVEPLERHN
jgi:5'-nucleotidase